MLFVESHILYNCRNSHVHTATSAPNIVNRSEGTLSSPDRTRRDWQDPNHKTTNLAINMYIFEYIQFTVECVILVDTLNWRLAVTAKITCKPTIVSGQPPAAACW